MIFLDKDTWIWHPGELFKKELRDKAVEAERYDRDKFIVPTWVITVTDLKEHHAVMAYKAGFLYEYLKEIHPEWPFKEIAKHLFWKYHVFLSERNLQNYLRKWRDHRNQFLKKGVLSQD